MGDELVADPDGMWKRDYDAPGDDPGRDGHQADAARREWFADYGRSDAAAEVPAVQPAPDLDLLSSPFDAVAEPPDVGRAAPRVRVGRRLVVAGSAFAVVAFGGVLWQVTGDDAAESPHRLASIPTAVAPAWTVELDAGQVTGVIGTPSAIVVLELVTNDLVGLAAGTGAERWRVNVAPSHSIAQLEEVDGAAIVLVEESTGDNSVAAYDLDSGERLWRRDGLYVAFQGSIYQIPAGAADGAVERLDARTGEGLNAVASRFSSAGWSHVSTVKDGLVGVFDLPTLERVAGPVAIDDVAAASVIDGRVVVLGNDATIRLYTSSGEMLSTLQTSIDQPDLFDVTDAADPMLLVVADGELVGYSLTGDEFSQVWRSGPVQVYEITDVGENTYAVVQPVVAAGPNGGPVRVIDTTTGDAVAEPSEGSSILLGNDGFVVEITDDEGGREAIEGYGYDGKQRWRFDLAREQQDLFLVDGAMVVVASDTAEQTSTLTYLK